MYLYKANIYNILVFLFTDKNRWKTRLFYSIEGLNTVRKSLPNSSMDLV